MRLCVLCVKFREYFFSLSFYLLFNISRYIFKLIYLVNITIEVINLFIVYFYNFNQLFIYIFIYNLLLLSMLLLLHK